MKARSEPEGILARNHVLARAAAILLPLLLGAAGWAQNQSVEEEATAPRYRIEVILFTHADANSGEELFEHEHERKLAATHDRAVAVSTLDTATTLPGTEGIATELLTRQDGDDGLRPGPEAEAERPIPDDGLAETAGTPDSLEFLDPFGRLGAVGAEDAEAAAALTLPGRPQGFRLLRSADYELGDAYAVIDRLGAYRPLGHAAWEQDALQEGVAEPLDLAYLGIGNPRGSIKLYLGRFLHIALDLEYAAGYLVSSTGPSPPDGALGQIPALSELRFGPTYSIQTERNAIRSGELHYVDHPIFGVLVRVTPAPEEEPEEMPTDGRLEPAA